MSTRRAPTPATRPAVRSLVMWSGGLDSTYTLLRLLEDSEDEVHVHHVHCNVRRDDGTRRSRRCEYEARAVARMRPWLSERCRPFEYGESRVDLSAFRAFARDSATMMFFAAQAALSLGFTPFDRICFGINADEDPRWRPGSERYALRRLLTIRMLKAVWEIEEVPYFYLWNPRPAKAAIWRALPAELRDLTASCRDPQADPQGFAEDALRPCGHCPKCRARAAAAAGGEVPPLAVAASG